MMCELGWCVGRNRDKNNEDEEGKIEKVRCKVLST